MLATNTRTCDDFGHRFDSVCFRQSTLIRHVCVFVSRAFSNRRVFDVNVRCISVDGRPKRIEMYAFSKENTLVWMGLYAYFSRLK